MTYGDRPITTCSTGAISIGALMDVDEYRPVARCATRCGPGVLH
jgi:hypothetical protein